MVHLPRDVSFVQLEDIVTNEANLRAQAFVKLANSVVKALSNAKNALVGTKESKQMPLV